MAGEYLTSVQVARLLGISKRTILNAVDAGELRAVYRMPGGGYRFMQPDVERYAEWRVMKRQVEEQARAAVRAQARQATAEAGASMASWVEQLSMITTESTGDARAGIANILALLADSLQVGMTVVARLEDAAWLIEQVHDRAGMGARPGAPLPWAELFALAFSGGPTASLIVEDVRTDARLSSLADAARWGVGTITAVPLYAVDGRLYGALCTLHPSTRTVPSGELPLLRLAAHMSMQALEAAAARDGERRAAQRAAQLAAIVEQSGDAIFRVSSSGQIETWNSGASRLFGYSTEEAIGQNIRMLVPADCADEQPHLLQTLNRGQDIVDYETVRLRKDGSTVGGGGQRRGPAARRWHAPHPAGWG
jgi:PAS domain S-box-containing protein/excisionase family DNA binding protein